MIYNNVLELIGHTPIVKYNDNIYLKLESFNPSGSVKDRASFSMLSNAMKRGEINKDTVIIEPTSGNTGIGLAMCCAVLGLKIIIVMPENMSEERKKSISMYGAELVLTPQQEGMAGAVKKAQELKSKYPNSFIPMQFENPDNPKAHEETAKEIYNDTNGKFDIVVAGIGTGGTAVGLNKYLKQYNPEICVYGVEPEESPLFNDGHAGPHKIQGIGANFIPKICENNTLDGIIKVKSDAAKEEAKNLIKGHGISAGISAGASLKAAKMLSEKFPNKIIVAIAPDGGDRYLSIL